MKGTLKLTTDNVKLSAELDGESITLSQEAEEYLRKTYPANISETEFGKSLELSGVELDCFETRIEGLMNNTQLVLHLKTVTPNESEDEWDMVREIIQHSPNPLQELKLNFHITKK